MGEEVTLVGRYRLDERLGHGAMGVVWKAFDLRLNRHVAVKILADHLSGEPQKVERFLTEAKIGAALEHPGITMVFDVDEHDGHAFFVMELLTGQDLAAVLSHARNGLPIERVVRIAERLARALAAAHAKNVVHRDVKPANIMLLRHDRPKICDFGVARFRQDAGSKATSGIGTAAYMAPEQFDGHLDSRADLYSLGCVMYEMLTGDKPFYGSSAQQLMYQHAMIEPIAPSSTRSDIPSVVEDLVLQLLAKKPDNRPQTGTEVAERLRAMQRVEPSVEEPPAPIFVKPFAPAKTKELYRRPPIQLLKSGAAGHRRITDENTVKAIAKVLHQSGVDAKVTGLTRGPACSRCEIHLGPTTQPGEVIALRSRIATAVGNPEARVILMARSSSPLPGVQAVAIELPHPKADTVSAGDVLRELPSTDSDRPLIAGLGRDRDGHPVALDLMRSLHLLIGGSIKDPATDPVRVIITSVLMRMSVEEVRMLLIDGQVDALSPFTGLPHLVEPIVTKLQAAAKALAWAVAEMERRYDDLSAVGYRTVDQYNKGVFTGRIPAPLRSLGDASLPHPRVLIVVNELAEVRSSAAEIDQLARLGKAAGVHIVLRTTRPDERTLTQQVKRYIPGRLGLPVRSPEASLRLLDHTGAETLGLGEALLRRSGEDLPRLLHLARVSDEEVAAVVGHCRRQE
ncbi:DNA translocase FtsK [Streptosporangium sp. V21-05]|uniref:DNA translocase FtsK n=1 Tax=Streptosporangium sp. V21-05 TaxID=3446115 RepID=UPI003F53E2EB